MLPWQLGQRFGEGAGTMDLPPPAPLALDADAGSDTSSDAPSPAAYLEEEFQHDGSDIAAFHASEAYQNWLSLKAQGEENALKRGLRSFEPGLAAGLPYIYEPGFHFTLPDIEVEGDNERAKQAWLDCYAAYEAKNGHVLYEDQIFFDNLHVPSVRAARRRWYSFHNSVGLRPYMPHHKLSYYRAIEVAKLFSLHRVAEFMENDDKLCYDAAEARCPRPPIEICYHCVAEHEAAVATKLEADTTGTYVAPALPPIVAQYDEEGTRINPLCLDHVKSYAIARGWSCRRCNGQLTPYLDHSIPLLEDLLERAALATESRADHVFSTPGGGFSA